jgi:Kef-type K+ transport system membrane component KefB
LEPIAESQTGRPFRLIVLYVVLGVLTVVVASVVIAKGQDEHPQPAVAGGYDATAPNSCLAAAAPPAKPVDYPSTAPAQPAPAGPSFDVKQSGQFVNLSNVQGTLGGKLRLKEGKGSAPRRLTGTVSCVNGKEQDFKGTITPANKGKGGLAGTLGGKPVTAVLRRDPPDAGTPKPRTPGDLSYLYTISPRSTCFGGLIELDGSGASYALSSRGTDLGKVAYVKETGVITGDVRCVRGGHAWLKGTAVDRNLNSVTLVPLDEATPVKPAPGAAPAPAGAKPALTTPSGLGPAGERFTAVRKREAFGKLVAAFFIAAAVVMVVARLFGLLAIKVGQPRVMGEVVAGITLGPTILGWISPSLQAAIFPSDIIPAFGVAANLGLIFYMFLVGLELDPGQLKGRVTQAAAISNASVALPMMLGIAAALPLYTVLGPDKKFVAFALFMGVSMSITAFPVLARILVERRMLKRPVGALTLACAAIDDVTAWFLIALATAVAVAGTSSDVIQTIALAIAFCLVMGLLVRPLISRVSSAYDEAGRVPGVWVAILFAGVLLSAYVTEEIGIALIFGGFIMGMVMPRNAGLTEDVTRRVEDFVVILLLPMFFAYTGLRTNVGLLDRPILWWITGGLIVIAIVGKLFGAMIAARVSGFDWRASTAIGTLMNTRGLTELIVLNLALEAGVISDALFAALVLMALVTTFMAGPMLNRLDPDGTRYGSPVEDELEEARAQAAADLPGVERPEHSILVAPRSDEALASLLSLAEPLANSHPRREIIMARLVRPPRAASVRGGLQTENAHVQAESAGLDRERRRLGEEGIVARGVAFISPDPGRDLSRLAGNEDVDLLLTDGYRPIVGEAIPLGEVKPVLLEAACDVGVLVAREHTAIEVGPDRPILVPFGGSEHDWSALELAVWLASGSGAPVRLLGAAGQSEEGKSVSRLLGDASLIVQQISGVTTEPLVVDSGEAILAAAEGAGLLSIGLSDRWRQEGLGETRSEIAKAANVPVVFIRRGTRPGALAPRGDATRFTWSRAGFAPTSTNGKDGHEQKPTEEKPAEPV